VGQGDMGHSGMGQDRMGHRGADNGGSSCDRSNDCPRDEGSSGAGNRGWSN
jgi:hypothetical protein